MKKGILVGIGLLSLLALLFWADKRSPGSPKSRNENR